MSRHRVWFIALGLWFLASRLIYFVIGLRPDIEPLGTYLQYIDPALLREHLWESLFYLREQPPGFNLYLGLVLKATQYPERIFLVIHLLMGAVLAFSLMALLLRLGVVPWLAFSLSALFAGSPITILYESWVFYTYPVMVGFCVAAWALWRYVTAARLTDAVLFFACLATVASVRGIYHLCWLLLLTVLILVIMPSHWKRTILAASIPVLLVVAFYAKNYYMFGDLIPGQQVYRKLNYAAMVQEQTPPELIDRLIREGKISAILKTPVLETNTSSYAAFVPQPQPTGIALLDMAEKPTGADNWNSLWRSRVADLYDRDAQVVAREQPGFLWSQARENLLTYLLPATDVFPFDDARNANLLRPFLDWYERITSGEFFQDPDSEAQIAWLNLVLFPACLIGALAMVLRNLARNREWTRDRLAGCATIVFALFNISYVSLVTVVFSIGDHNRYREEIAPLYVLLIGLLLNAVWSRSRKVMCRTSTQYAEWS